MLYASQYPSDRYKDPSGFVWHRETPEMTRKIMENIYTRTETAWPTTFMGPTFIPPILRLPDEILVRILKCLDPFRIEDRWEARLNGLTRGGVRPELCAVALTCKKLARLTTEVLLREVNLATGYVSSLDPTYSSNRLRSFIRTCNENPNFVNQIRSLQMQCDFSATPAWGATSDNLLPDTVLQVVSRLSTLNDLSLVLSAASHIQWLPRLLIGYSHGIEGSVFSNLQSLFLACEDSPIPPSVLWQILCLPTLRTIEIDAPVGMRDGALDLTTMGLFLPPKGLYSNVEAIYHCDDMSSSTALQELLPSTPKLNHLSATMSGAGLVFDDYNSPHHFHTSSPNAQIEFSPFHQQNLLTPIIQTLKYLSLSSRQALISAHDDTLLDLSTFGKLKFLHVSIHHICQASLKDAEKSSTLR